MIGGLLDDGDLAASIGDGLAKSSLRIAIGHSSSTAPASTNPLGGGSRTGLRRSFLNEHAPYRVISRGVVVDLDDLIDDGQAGENRT